MRHKFKVLVPALLFTILVQTLIHQFNGAALGIPSESHDADSLWLEPSSMSFSIVNSSVGYRFNITSWLNVTSDNIFSYQVGLLYNRSQLRCVRGGFTAGITSDFMSGHTTSRSGPIIDTSYLGNGSVLVSETCLAPDYVSVPHYGSLVWMEFEIIAEPSAGETLSSLFDITTTYPVGTWVCNPDVVKIPITTYDSTYTFIYGLPVIISVSRFPEAPNYYDEVVVSANISDDFGVDEAILSYTCEAFWHNVSMNRTSDTFNATIPSQPYETIVEYMVYANDTDGNWAESIVHSYCVGDPVSPEIVDVKWEGTAPYPYESSEEIRSGEAALITATIHEPNNASGVAEIQIFYRVNSSEWWNTTMEYRAWREEGTAVIPADGLFLVTGNTVIEFYFIAYDHAGNAITSPIYSFNVKSLITGDINGDGVVDGLDIIVVAANFGKGTP